MKYRFSLFLVLFSFSSLFSQRLEKFSTDNSFIDELKDFMTASKSSSMEDTYKKFEKLFKSAYFTLEQKDTIKSTANLMLQQRMTANPYFSAYLKALGEVKNHEFGDKRFVEWHEVLKDILLNIENRRLKPYKNFLDFSIDYFAKKALRSSKLGVNWAVTADKNLMAIEENKILVKFEKNRFDCFAWC